MRSRFFAELAGWLATRMPARRYLPLAAALAIAAALAGTPDWRWSLAAWATALCLVFQFRLWDDLADASLDRIEHPERILPRSESSLLFRAAAWTAGAVNLCALGVLSGLDAALGLLVLSAAYGAWYRRPPRARRGLVAANFVVIKYPAFVLLLAPLPADAAKLAGVCAAVYVAFVAYELLHDPRSYA